jgi:sulfonate transport system substrate-binding protein
MDNRPPSPILPIDEKILQAQQATADLFYQNHLLPKSIDVKKAIENN